jgi:hypothetical protein
MPTKFKTLKAFAGIHYILKNKHPTLPIRDIYRYKYLVNRYLTTDNDKEFSSCE